MADDIDITGLDKAAVLAALYNASRPIGLSHFVNAAAPQEMSVSQAAVILKEAAPFTYFDYLWGRVMKISLKGGSLNPRLYDRDNGEGAAEAVIQRLRAGR